MPRERTLIQFDHYHHGYRRYKKSKKAIIQICRQTLQEQMSGLFDCLDIVERVFTGLATHAQHYEQQKHYFMVLKQYSFEKSTIKKNLKNNLLKQYDNFFTYPSAFLRQSSQSTDYDPSFLSELEQDKRQSHQQASGELIKRFSAIQNISSTSIHNPLSIHFCMQFFTQSLNKLSFDSEHKRQIEQQIKPSLVIELTALYQRLNQTLARQGILAMLSISHLYFHHFSMTEQQTQLLLSKEKIPVGAIEKAVMIDEEFIWPIGSRHLSPSSNARQAIYTLLVRYSPTPSKLIPILYEGYIPLLTEYFHKQNHEDKLAILDNIKRLISSLVSQATINDSNNIPFSINSIYQLARQQLKQSPIDNAKLTQLLELLKQCHILAIKGEEIDNRDLYYYVAHNIASVRTVTSDVTNIFPELAIGQWIHIENQTSPIKLSWRSNLTDRYLFVNQYGEKVGEWSKSELSQLFWHGKAYVTDKPKISNHISSLLHTIEGRKDHN